MSLCAMETKLFDAPNHTGIVFICWKYCLMWISLYLGLLKYVQFGVDVWKTKLSYVPRWITYIIFWGKLILYSPSNGFVIYLIIFLMKQMKPTMRETTVGRWCGLALPTLNVSIFTLKVLYQFDTEFDDTIYRNVDVQQRNPCEMNV